IDGVIIEPLGFEENLMRRAIAKTMDLVLDRRAIARPRALDLPGIHGRALDVRRDDVMGLSRRMRDVAADLGVGNGRRQDREGHRLRSPGLPLEEVAGNGPAVEPWRRPGLEAAERELVFLELCR